MNVESDMRRGRNPEVGLGLNKNLGNKEKEPFMMESVEENKENENNKYDLGNFET